MTPKNSGLNTGCTDAVSSNCVTWQGPTISCIGLCHGQSVSDVIAAIGDKICAIAAGLDLSTLDLSCLIDIVEPTSRTIQTILQLILDNQCTLKDLIDNLSSDPSDEALNLNLRCLKKFDDFGNEIPQDLNQALQSIVNQVCANKTDIVDIKADIIDLQNQIDSIDTTSYVEPNITVCTVAGARPLSQAVPIVANDLCNYKIKVGTTAEITTAIARQCSDAQTDFGGVSGWIASPTSLADTVNNMWIMICSLQARVSTMETTCCAVSCDDIQLGYSAVFNDDYSKLIITFNYANGTVIPAGFANSGSNGTITDSDGNVKTFNITIDDDMSLEVDIAGLNTNAVMEVNINATLTNGSLTCSHCLSSKVYPSSCAYCDFEVTGDGYAIIVYTVEDGA